MNLVTSSSDRSLENVQDHGPIDDVIADFERSCWQMELTAACGQPYHYFVPRRIQLESFGTHPAGDLINAC